MDTADVDTADVRVEDEPASPRIARLVADLDAGRDGAVAAFWDDVRRTGAPLEEPAVGDHALLTFVWRATSPAVAAVELKASPRWRGPLASWLQYRTFARDAAGTRRLRRVAGTDVWYDTSLVRNDLRMTYSFAEVPEAAPPTDPYEPGALDPFNAGVFPDATSDPAIPPDDPDWHAYRVSTVRLSGAPPTGRLVAGPGVPRGRVTEHRFDGARLGGRRVWVYTPPGDGHEYGDRPVLVMHDGWNWAGQAPIAPILDHLIHAGAIPPLVAVLHESPDRDELVLDEAFVDALADELLPWCRERYAVTADPARTVVAGQSHGGLNAAFCALRRPDTVGNVLSQSGSFWVHGESEFDVDYGRLIAAYARAPVVPARFYLDVGLLESYMVTVNRHMRDVLLAKGYPVTYREVHGDHTWFSWRDTVADGLVALTGQW